MPKTEMVYCMSYVEQTVLSQSDRQCKSLVIQKYVGHTMAGGTEIKFTIITVWRQVYQWLWDQEHDRMIPTRAPKWVQRTLFNELEQLQACHKFAAGPIHQKRLANIEKAFLRRLRTIHFDDMTEIEQEVYGKYVREGKIRHKHDLDCICAYCEEYGVGG